jgi:hypothetical protein
MNDEQRNATQRADAAKRIMDDPLVKEALQSVEDGITEAWKDVPARDVEAREHLHRLLQAKRQFENVFRICIETGAIARAELQAEEERKTLLTRVKEFVNG